MCSRVSAGFAQYMHLGSAATISACRRLFRFDSPIAVAPDVPKPYPRELRDLKLARRENDRGFAARGHTWTSRASVAGLREPTVT